MVCDATEDAMTKPVTLSKKDFDVFAIDGFGPRMEAFKTVLRPHLVAVAERLAPAVSEVAGHPLYVHVAKHARRTVNPPAESWAAFASQPRGYKKLPHFALCVSRAGVHARVVLKDEALDARSRLVKACSAKKLRELGPALAKVRARDYSRWDAVTLPDELSGEASELKDVVAHAGLKTGHFSVGVFLGAKASDDDLLDTFRALKGLYALGLAKR